MVGLDWLAAVMNALSLAVGVAVGSLITFYLTKRELRKTFDEFRRSEVYVNLLAVLKGARGLVESPEAKLFFVRASEALKSFTMGCEKDEPVLKLPKKPEKPKSP